MNHLVFVCITCAAAVCVGQTQPLADSISADEVLQCLRDREQALAGKRIVFEETLFIGKGEVPQWTDASDLTPWLASRASCSAIFLGGRHRIERHIADARGELTFTLNGSELFTWNGTESRCIVSAPRASSTLNLVIRSDPPVGHAVHGFMGWLGWTRNASGTKVNFATLFDLHRLRASRESKENGATRYYFTLDERPTLVSFTTVRRNELVDLRSIELLHFRTRDEISVNDNPASLERITLSESGFDGNQALSSSATILRVINLDRPPDERIWNLNIVEGTSIDDAVIGQETFRPRIVDPPGQVLDTRYKITYALGESRISVDGRWLYTHEPALTDDAGDNLLWWIERGEWEPEEQFRPARAISNEARRAPLYRFAIAGLCCLAAVLVVVWPRRKGKQLTRDTRMVALWTILFVVVGCADPDDEGEVGLTGSFDAGEIRIDEGPSLAAHSFDVINTTSEAIQIVEVLKTCGCLDAQLDSSILRPGERTTLSMSFEVNATGYFGEEVALILADGQMWRYALRAKGVASQELHAIRLSTTTRSTRSIPIRFLLLNSSLAMEREPPVVLQPPGISLVFEKWDVLENPSAESGRPLRLTAQAQLDFSDYPGPFPVTISLRSASGAKCTLTVDAPEDSDIAS